MSGENSQPLAKKTALSEKLKRALENKNPATLRRILNRRHFADVADAMMTGLTDDEVVRCFQYLNMGQAAQVLISLDDERQARCLDAMPGMMGSKILRTMAADDAVDILQELDEAASQRLLEGMPRDQDTRSIESLLLEEPDTAAGLMSTDYVAVPMDATIEDALKQVRQSEEKDFIYYVYITDETGELMGVSSIKQLLIQDAAMPVYQMMVSNPITVLINYDDTFVANLFRKYDNLLAMPVVDAHNVLRGIITVDDVIDIIEEERSEELYRASGINIEELDEKHLLTGHYMQAVKARLPWLSITMVGQMLSASIIASFETTIQTAVIAVSFMPLLTGLAGNMGTQSDTISVRGLAQGLITSQNIGSKVRRELAVALVIGCTFSVVVGFCSFMLYRQPKLTLLLCTWIVLSLMTTALIGILIPYSYSRFLKKDPAGVGGPFITTTTDLMTFSLYLYILSLLFV